MTARADFLARVRREMARAKGLAPVGAVGRPADPAGAAVSVRAAARERVETLFARFRTEAEQVGVAVHRVATATGAGEVVWQLAAERGVRRVVTWGGRRLGPAAAVADRLRAGGLAIAQGSPEEVADASREPLRGVVAAADLGLTAADLAIAETGSLVLASGPGKGRGVSLLPAIHVAVFGPDVLVEGLEEAALVLQTWHAGGPPGANVVFVTGPSRTADIELTLTRGVHGPRELHAVFVETPEGS